MNVALRSWTVEEFLAWKERQELRYEFDGVRPVASVVLVMPEIGIEIPIAASSRSPGHEQRHAERSWG